MAAYRTYDPDLVAPFLRVRERYGPFSNMASGYQIRVCGVEAGSSEMGWLPPSPDGIAMCQDGGVESHEAERTAI